MNVDPTRVPAADRSGYRAHRPFSPSRTRSNATPSPPPSSTRTPTATARRRAPRASRWRSRRAARVAADGEILLTPPLAQGLDRIAGPASGPATLVVFGAHGTPWSRPLGAVLDAVRRRHLATVGVAWRHYPDPAAHPHDVVLALAVEAAAEAGRFWVLTRELLQLRHHDPEDLHRALVRSSLDPEQVIEAMRRGAGADRIGGDVESALASGVIATPALFIGGERYRGELAPEPVLAAFDRALRGARRATRGPRSTP